MGYRTSEGFLLIGPIEEVPPNAEDVVEGLFGLELTGDPRVEAPDTRKGREVALLELEDEVDGDADLLAQGWRLPVVVTSVAEPLGSIPIGKGPVEGFFSQFSILPKITSPVPLGINHTCNVGMDIARFCRIEVAPVVEQDPAQEPNFPALRLFLIEPVELPAGVRDKYTPKLGMDILKISPGSKAAL